MSDDLVPMQGSPYTGASQQVQAWQEPGMAPPPPGQEPSPLERPLAAVRRYKWLVIGMIVIASAAGVAATHFVKPGYDVRATIRIATQQALEDRTGPIRAPTIMEGSDWLRLFKAYLIEDSVVRKLKLYIKPANAADSTLFRDFTLVDRGAKGVYQLTIDRTRKHWQLTSETVSIADSGSAADSVGRPMGFAWTLPPSAFVGTGDQKVAFTVSTPRETAVEWNEKMNAVLPEEKSSFIQLSLQDENADLAALVVNTWDDIFVSVASDIKKQNLAQFSHILDGQLSYAEVSLKNAEAALGEFKTKTITSPTEGGPVAAGITDTRDPVMKNYFERAIELDNLKSDRMQLEEIIRLAKKDSVAWDAMLSIPSISSASASSQTLRQAFDQLAADRVKRASLSMYYTDSAPNVKPLVTEINTLNTQRIPDLANQFLMNLKNRETEDSTRIQAAGNELQQIPDRTIEELRLQRAVTVAEGLYTMLKGRYAEAQLGQEAAEPDVSVLDRAVAPLRPAKNTAVRIILLAIGAGIGCGLGLAILLDKLDKRLRYPEQATDELGLPIAGTVPRFPKGGIDQRSPEQMFQLVESFRSLRMTVTSATGSPLALAISSPSPGDGKSLISANLAMSFADSGMRTVLVDGDTRRGTLHDVFALSTSPGLTDYLGERATLGEILRSTSHDKLAVIPCGVRQRQSPELLTTPLLAQLIKELRAQFDVVIFDTPPLAAGIDGYSIAAATGALLIVLRVGATERRMAAAKLRLLDRLPVNVIGAVLNGVEFRGEYEYYGYIGGDYQLAESTSGPPGTDIAELP